MSAAPLQAEELVIRPPTRFGTLGLGELWPYRELLYFMIKRELQLRYKQSIFGVSWAVLQPLALTLIFTIFFNRAAHVPSEGLPYPIFALTALVPWTFAAQGVTNCALSLVSDSNLLSKVYFPRLVIPIAKVLSLLIDLVIALGVLAVFMVIYDVEFRLTAFALPLFLLIAVATALALGSLLAALNVRYRDVNVAVPLLVQIWLFVTPVIYPGSLVTGYWKYVYAVNPMVSVMDGTRWALLGTPAPTAGTVAVSAVSAAVLLVIAGVYFSRTQRFFADII